MLERKSSVVTRLFAAGILALLALTRITSAQGTFKVLHAFTWANGPKGLLARDAYGNLYGTTTDSKVGEGTVWKLAPQPDGTWRATILHVFTCGADGGYPVGGVILDRAGNLYGTTQGGPTRTGNGLSPGVVFKLSYTSRGWRETVLHTFGGKDSGSPSALVTFDTAGNLYGTTSCVVFKLAPNSDGTWSETVLHNFTSGADWTSPVAGLTFDDVGNLYGTAIGGGAACFWGGCGLVFKLSPHVDGNWTYTVLHGFTGMDGGDPIAGLTLDAAGNLYGTTALGGVFDAGVVFKLAPNPDGTWAESVLHSFGSGAWDGSNPLVAVTFDPDGNLYGTTVDGGIGGGVVYKLTPTSRGWDESVIHTFESNGFFPDTPILIDPRGHLYGTTNASLVNNGFVFEITP